MVFSHLHYDHMGDPSRFGPKTEFIIGPDAKSLKTGPKSYPADALALRLDYVPTRAYLRAPALVGSELLAASWAIS